MEIPLSLIHKIRTNSKPINRPQTPKAPYNYDTEVVFINPIDKNSLAGNTFNT
jgi:hypothetical protein